MLEYIELTNHVMKRFSIESVLKFMWNLFVSNCRIPITNLLMNFFEKKLKNF